MCSGFASGRVAAAAAAPAAVTSSTSADGVTLRGSLDSGSSLKATNTSVHTRVRGGVETCRAHQTLTSRPFRLHECTRGGTFGLGFLVAWTPFQQFHEVNVARFKRRAFRFSENVTTTCSKVLDNFFQHFGGTAIAKRLQMTAPSQICQEKPSAASRLLVRNDGARNFLSEGPSAAGLERGLERNTLYRMTDKFSTGTRAHR